MDLIFFYQALAKRKWLVLLLTILAAAIGFSYAFLKKKSYLSSAQYSTGLTMQSKALQEDFNVFEIDVKFNNVLETFKSPNVIGMMTYRILQNDLTAEKPFKVLTEKEKAEVDALGIAKEKAVQILKNKIDSVRLLSTANADENKLIEMLEIYGYDYESFVSTLSINRLARTDYIDIIYRSENPILSATVVNAIGPEFMRFYNSLSNVRSNESMESINRQLQQKAKEFDSTFSKLQSTKVGLGTADISAAVSAALSIVQDYETKLAEEKGNYNRNVAQLQSVNGQLQRMPAPVSSGGNNSEIVAIRKQISALETENNNKGGNDQAILQRIKKLQQDLIEKGRSNNAERPDEELRKTLQQRKYELEADIASAKGNISEYESMIRKYQAQASSLAGKDVDVSREQAKADIASKEFADLKQRFEAVQGFKQDGGLNFRQTLMGQPALKPESSRTILTTGLAGAVTFFLISFIILLSAFFDNSIKSPVQFARVTGFKTLVNLSMISLKKQSVISMLEEPVNEKKATDKALFINGIQQLRIELQSQKVQSLLLASYEKGEGKTTVIIALAKALAAAGKKVLVIDANYVAPLLTEQLGAGDGFTNILGTAIDEKALKSAIVKTSIDGVDAIGLSATSLAPVGLASTVGAIAEYVKNVQLYDVLLMEVPALKYHVDGLEVLGFAEAVVTVHAANNVMNTAAIESVQRVQQYSKYYLGAVLNKVELDVLEM